MTTDTGSPKFRCYLEVRDADDKGGGVSWGTGETAVEAEIEARVHLLPDDRITKRTMVNLETGQRTEETIP